MLYIVTAIFAMGNTDRQCCVDRGTESTPQRSYESYWKAVTHNLFCSFVSGTCDSIREIKQIALPVCIIISANVRKQAVFFGKEVD